MYSQLWRATCGRLHTSAAELYKRPPTVNSHTTMDRRLVISLSVAAVLLSVAHGFPQEASAEVPAHRLPLDDLTKVSALEDAKTTPAEKTDKRESPDLPKSEPVTSLGAKLKVHFPPSDPSLPKSVLALKEEDDDSVRSTRQSPSMGFGRGPPTTTVCIQVRSDHPEVVCGPQVADEKKMDPPSARYAYPEYYARATPQYPQRYAQQPPPQPPMGSLPTPIMAPMYPARRREEEIKSMEQIVPQAPLRGIQTPPMILHRPFYQPVVSTGLYPQPSQLLRLNCGVQSEGAQLYNSPLLRSSSPLLMGYYPVGEQVVTLQDPILASSRLDPLRARVSSGLHLESPYVYSSADPWSSSAYLGESGFYPMDMQGRSAGSGLDEQYSNTFMGYPSESSMDDSNRSFLQEQELQQSRLRLRMLQKQLRELHQRSSADEDLKETPASDNPQETSSIQEQKKDQANRTRQGKRQTRTKEI